MADPIEFPAKYVGKPEETGPNAKAIEGLRELLAEEHEFDPRDPNTHAYALAQGIEALGGVVDYESRDS